MVIALNDKKPISSDKEIASIVQSLSRDDTIKKDQLKSMIIVLDAFVKFSGHIVQRSAEIEKLTKEKRESLMNIVSVSITCMSTSFHPTKYLCLISLYNIITHTL